MAVTYNDVIIEVDTPADVIVSAREDHETGRVYVGIRAEGGGGYARVVISMKASDCEVFMRKIRKAIDVALREGR